MELPISMLFQFRNFVQLLMLVGLSHATSIVKRTADEPCPLIHRKPEQECIGKISECW
jgi:hypothetical protein